MDVCFACMFACTPHTHMISVEVGGVLKSLDLD